MHTAPFRTKSRITGSQRFEPILDKDQRRKSQNKQITQIKKDLGRLLVTTGAHSALLIIPESWCVHKFATAGDFNSFLEMYSAALLAQQLRKKTEVPIRIDDIWERFKAKGGLHQIEET